MGMWLLGNCTIGEHENLCNASIQIHIEILTGHIAYTSWHQWPHKCTALALSLLLLITLLSLLLLITLLPPLLFPPLVAHSPLLPLTPPPLLHIGPLKSYDVAKVWSGIQFKV